MYIPVVLEYEVIHFLEQTSVTVITLGSHFGVYGTLYLVTRSTRLSIVYTNTSCYSSLSRCLSIFCRFSHRHTFVWMAFGTIS